MIHNRTIQTAEWGELHFASLDGAQWLPVNRPVQEGEEAALARAFDPGDFLPMRLATSYLDFLEARG